MVYIAHFDGDNSERIETVKEHLEHTKELCINYSSPDFKNLASMSAILHDLGKYSEAFQLYISNQQDSLHVNTKDIKKVIHSTTGMQLIMDHYHNSNNGFRKLTAEILGEIICSHHGGLVDMGNNFKPVLQTKVENYSEIEYKDAIKAFYTEICTQDELDELFDRCCLEIQNFYIKINSITNENKYKKSYWFFMIQMLIKYLYSCLIDADRTNTYCFIARIESIDTKCRSWDTYEQNLNESICKYNLYGLCDSEMLIGYLRKNVSDQCFEKAKENRGIYRLTVPTGGGKTLSSIRFALAHRIINQMDRIIYVLPYTSIIEQNAQEIRNKLGCDSDLFENHSNVVVNNIDEYGELKYDLLASRWDSAIIFTTMVQFLNTFFDSSTQNMRRLHNLYNSIIIFDEIQSVPGKCISMFNSTISFLKNICNCSIVLCSATQIKLEKAPHKLDSPIELLNNIDYLFEKFKRMEVIDSRCPALSYKDAAEFIIAKKTDSKSVLCITNTKTASSEIYDNLKKYADENKIEIFYLSTYLCPAHRKDIIAEIKNKLHIGKPLICISTQLIEAGVDISFETVIRSEAGLDSVVQASGRGNRNGERILGHTYLIKLSEEKTSLVRDIEWGQSCTEATLIYRSNNIERYGDILSEKTINKFYDELFNNQSDYYRSMNYRISDTKNMYDMLSNKYNCFTNKDYILQYPFKTASENFNVIDQNTKTVLVPYKQGTEIINSLGSNETSLSEKYDLIKKSQMYCVQLWPQDFEKIKNGIYFYEDVGIYVLSEPYYDSKGKGVVRQSSLIFCEY